MFRAYRRFHINWKRWQIVIIQVIGLIYIVPHLPYLEHQEPAAAVLCDACPAYPSISTIPIEPEPDMTLSWYYLLIFVIGSWVPAPALLISLLISFFIRYWQLFFFLRSSPGHDRYDTRCAASSFFHFRSHVIWLCRWQWLDCWSVSVLFYERVDDFRPGHQQSGGFSRLAASILRNIQYGPKNALLYTLARRRNI